MHFSTNITDTLKLHRSILTDLQKRLGSSQSSITLTTSGTSGASTLIGNSLNIPVYSSGAGSSSWGSITGTLSNQTDLNNALNLKQNTLSLTTNNTSGAATLISNVLNIPQYSGGGGGGTNFNVLIDGGTFAAATLYTLIDGGNFI